MKYAEAQQGRTFIVRLEDGDVLHESLEKFAREKGVLSAAVIVLGGADAGSILISGPRAGRPKNEADVEPMEHVLESPYEITGTGTIFPDKKDNPVLHMHIACGRKQKTKTGCVRRGVKVWHVMEAVIIELIGTNSRRIADPVSGFELLVP